jgi:two-component system cell cycle sensor histidine kinase/response regulator CckA
VSATVLVVDHSDRRRAATRDILAGAGFTVLAAAAVPEGLAGAPRRPDLIVAAVDAGKSDVWRALRADPLTAAIPLLGLVDAAGHRREDRGTPAAVADAYLRQPVDAVQLVAVVRGLLPPPPAEAGPEPSEARHRAAELLARTARDLTAPLDYSAIARGIVQRVASLFATEGAVLRVLEPDGSLTAVAAAGIPLPSDPADPAAASGLYSALAAPLRIRGAVAGTLAIGQKAPRDFTADEAELLQAFADQAAIGLHNARLSAESERRHRTAESLAVVGRALSASPDLEEVARRIAESLRALLGVRAAGFLKLEPRSGDLVGVAVAGDVGPGFPARVVFQRGTGLAGLAVQERRPVFSANILADERVVLTPELRVALERAPYRAGVALPLIAKEAVIGVLFLADTEGWALDDDDLALVQAFADQAALALENARLYQDAERRRQEAETAAQALRAIVGTSSEWIWEIDRAGRITFSNPAVEAILGYAPAELVGQDSLTLLHEEDRRWVERERSRRVEEHRGWRDWVLRWRHRDGSYRHLEGNAVPVLDAAGRLMGYRGSDRDITERRKAEEALRQSQQVLRAVIDTLPAMVSAKGLDLRYLFVNRVIVDFFGVQERDVVGRRAVELFEAETARRAEAVDRDVIATGQAAPYHEEEYPDRRGMPRQWLTTKVPLRDPGGRVGGVVTIAVDITDRKRLEAQLQQALKTEAVGRLAGGVAHDFNNLLTVILGRSDLLMQSLAGEDPLRRSAELIKTTAERAATLTHQLLAFSRRQTLQPRVLDLNALIVGMTAMLRRLIGEHIEMVSELDPEVDRVRADPAQLEQVVLNLVVNARDAMPGGGRLTVATGTLELDEVAAAQLPEVSPGRYVTLTVSDTGTGMDEATQAHLFEPFFTTKGPGKGTGLGLATVYGIVKQSGGHVLFESMLGIGTTFRILLPGVPDAVDDLGAGLGRPRALPGTETILLVEDEEELRELAREVLEAEGYRVLEAASGSAAMAVAAEHQGPIHLVITDVVMPGMSGPETVDHLARDRPELRVLYMSGYTDDAIGQHGVLAPGVALIAKPFTPADLGSRVREVLDAPSPPSAAAPTA